MLLRGVRYAVKSLPSLSNPKSQVSRILCNGKVVTENMHHGVAAKPAGLSCIHHILNFGEGKGGGKEREGKERKGKMKGGEGWE